jgi:DtxR family transcriptional regulator, Mn-dependent transcriptional regulator
MLSPSTEDYLKALYELSGQEGRAHTGGLARRLGVSPASVTGMLRKLAGHTPQLVVYHRHRGAELSPEGRRRAMEIIRHHRLIETFLHQELEIPWDQVHAEADRMEHTLSEAVEDRMADRLGHPVVDPHGALIPEKDGSLPPRAEIPLARLSPGESGRVAQVPDEDSALLRHLDDLGLRPGAPVTLLDREPIDGLMRIRVAGHAGDRLVGQRVAEAVSVERLTPK